MDPSIPADVESWLRGLGASVSRERVTYVPPPLGPTATHDPKYGISRVTTTYLNAGWCREGVQRPVAGPEVRVQLFDPRTVGVPTRDLAKVAYF